MKKFANLDDNINVYAGHEYGLSNLKFVKSIMNTEQVIRSYEEVLKKNKRGRAGNENQSAHYWSQ